MWDLEVSIRPTLSDIAAPPLLPPYWQIGGKGWALSEKNSVRF